MLALHGQRNAEGVRQAKDHLAATLGITTLAEMLDVIAAADLSAIPADAASLRRWLERAAAPLPAGP